ncbi:MAG: cell wall-active antibiotics response protein [Rudanella sp.]|nr:cell wall-active antibiotics response protein [Rudanella sp.]
MNRGLFWGIFFVTIGLLFLARNLGWLAIDWETIRNLWPLLLILAGVNLILERQRSQAAIATTVLLAIAAPVALFSFVGRHHDDWNNNRDRWEYRSDDNENDNNDQDDNDNDATDSGDDDEDDISTSSVSKFVESMEGETPEAVLKFGGGAGRFSIGETTTNLIDAEAKQTVGTYKMAVDRDPTTRIPTIELKPNEGKTEYKGGKLANRIDIKLNDKPIWTLDLGLGAGEGDFDLSRYSVKNLKVQAGAADIDIKLGDRADLVTVDLQAGVASMVVQVPQGVGCRVEKQGGMNVNQLDGFDEISDRVMQTPGYDGAKKKINIVFNGGISRFKVERY